MNICGAHDFPSKRGDLGKHGKWVRNCARRPVSRVLYPWFPTGDDHSSGTPVTGRLTRPTRTATRKCVWLSRRKGCRPYLVLLPVGFAVPLPLPVARCALTAPFHPYRPNSGESGRRFAFCGTFPRVTPAGRYPAPYFRGARTFLPRGSPRKRPSGHLARAQCGPVGARRQGEVSGEDTSTSY